MKFSGKNCSFTLHSVDMDTYSDLDLDRQALDADPDADPAR
jgi:hypothetical protein